MSQCNDKYDDRRKDMELTSNARHEYMYLDQTVQSHMSNLLWKQKIQGDFIHLVGFLAYFARIHLL